jgi:predicted metal-binding membrane protein
MTGAALPRMEGWTPRELGLMLAMWAVMMVAMMTPSAAPMILMFAQVHRGRRERRDPSLPTGLFLLGYLLVWGLFGAGATLAQWGLHSTLLLSDGMKVASPALGAGLLLAAGLYQWTPLKEACLRRCRTPLGFVMSEWREGARGAVVMGLRHGMYCAGCCWSLMLLLFAAGVMNLAWVAALTVFVLVEKQIPHGRWLSRLSGAGLAAWGAAVAGWGYFA